MAYVVVATPIGEVVVSGVSGRVCGLEFADSPKAAALATGRRDDSALREVVVQLRAYFAGELTSFSLSLDPRGTPFQRSVWEALRAIPYGSTTTYGELAAEIGRPRAIRAVGAANGRNPISIIIPCHRVVGADGSLTGYGGGLPRKQWLLAHERRLALGNQL